MPNVTSFYKQYYFKNMFFKNHTRNIIYFCYAKLKTGSAARTGELVKVINHEHDETLAYKTKFIPIFHEDRNLPSFLSNSFDFCSALEENLTPYSAVGLRHQKLIAGFAFLRQPFVWMLPSILRWKAHKKLTRFRACRVVLSFIPGVTYCFFKQSKQRGFSRRQFLLFYCSINFIYVQICCFYQFGMRERDASGGRNMTVLQNEALGRTGAGDASATLDDQSY